MLQLVDYKSWILIVMDFCEFVLNIILRAIG